MQRVPYIASGEALVDTADDGVTASVSVSLAEDSSRRGVARRTDQGDYELHILPLLRLDPPLEGKLRRSVNESLAVRSRYRGPWRRPRYTCDCGVIINKDDAE